LPADTNHSENIATAVTEVSERMTVLVHEEIELAKAEMATKFSSIARGAAAVAAGAAFGFFALIFALETIAWALNAVLISGAGNLWEGFLIVTAVLLVMALAAFMFARRKLRVGAPTPKMAIDEAKLIRETVTTSKPQDGA
jgi:uncharacterized small protein (DUF1192 family)